MDSAGGSRAGGVPAARRRRRKARDEAPPALPVLPLRSVVVLPGERAWVSVGRAGSLAAVRAAQEGDGRLLLCPQRDPEVEDPGAEDLHEVGTVARLLDAREEGGARRVEVEGTARLRWSPAAAGDHGPCLCAIPPEREGEPPGTPETAEGALVEPARWLWQQVKGLPEMRGADATPGWPPPEQTSTFVDALAGRLLSGRAQRLEVLGRLDVADRLQALHRALLPRLPRPEATGQTVALRMRRQMERAQREYFLREQMRAIRRELGEEEDASAEADRLRGSLRAAQPPAPALEAGLREAARLERMPPVSSEAVIARTYLEWLIALPWSRRADERLDLAAARDLLDREHEGLAAVKERILEHLAVHILRTARREQGGGAPAVADASGTVLCLAGPPGTGKTSLARSVAAALGRPFVRVALGGVRDEAEVRGHRRTYVGALPGRVIAAMRRAGVRNPLMLLDEIDKLGEGAQGDPGAALLEVLDPEQQVAFSDHYLEVPFDLSDVMFVATANDLRTLAPPLRDRLEVLQLPGYGEDEKVAIARRYLLPRQSAAHALPPGALTLTAGALRALVRGYSGEAGVRALDRQVASLCRKVAREVLADPGARVRLTARTLEQWLGPPTAPTAAWSRDPGVALGVVWSEAGARVSAVDAVASPGEGVLRVIPPEARAEVAEAAACLTAPGAAWGPPEVSGRDLLVRLAVEPGADLRPLGLAILVALVSATRNRPVAARTAIVGAITPRGRVLAVPRLAELVGEAGRAGLRRIVLPEAERRTWEALPYSARAQLAPIFARDAAAAVAAALGDAPADPPPGSARGSGEAQPEDD